MFTGNTWDSSGVNPEGEAWGICTELLSVLLINTDGGWLTGLYHCRDTKSLLCFSPLLCSLCYQTECSAEQLLAPDLSYCWLYPSKKAIDRFMLFACLDCVLFSRLEHQVKQVLTANLSACAVGAGRLLIARSMNNITGPTDTRTEPGYTHMEGYSGWGERLHARVLTIQIAMF